MRRFAWIALLGLVAVPTLALAANDFLSLNPFPGGRALQGPAGDGLKQDAAASAAALKAADDDLHARNQTQPDGRYIQVLQQTFIQQRSVASKNVIALAPTSDPNILANADFARNLQRLFQAQANNITQNGATTSLAANPRIIGGFPTLAATDVVAIVGSVPGADDELCSGTIFGSNTASGGRRGTTAILTAGHCVCETSQQTVRVGAIVSDSAPYSAYLVTSRALFSGSCPTRIAGEAPDKYSMRVQTALAGRDLAVIVTDEAIPTRLGSNRPILGSGAFAHWIAANAGSNTGFSVRAMGYGYTTIGNGGILTGSGQRTFADIGVVDAQCDDSGAVQYGCNDHGPVGELVTGSRPFDQVPTQFNCSGDSGGPILASMVQNGQTAYYTIGITSRGTTSACGAGGIFSLVTSDAVSSWLHDKFGASVFNG